VHTAQADRSPGLRWPANTSSAVKGFPPELESHRRGFGSRLTRLALASVGLALALHAGRLVVLAALGLRKQAVLLHSAGEFLEGGLERVSLSDQDFAHSGSSLPRHNPACLVSFLRVAASRDLCAGVAPHLTVRGRAPPLRHPNEYINYHSAEPISTSPNEEVWAQLQADSCILLLPHSIWQKPTCQPPR
jgi:hypothetical protein